MPDTEGSQVIVVGAGIAGLSAALRLAERDFKVTLVEQNNFLGGKLGAHKHVEPCPDDYHEHSFHMYLNWYHNFWRIADEIGLLQHFTPAPEMNYLKPKQFVREGKPLRLINVGALASSWHNIFSGVESPADMLTYGYSLIDLLGTPVRPTTFASTSVYGFLASRPYMTDRAIALHGQTLAKAFASPTYLNAAQTYRKFISYGFRRPTPMTWLLKGNTETYLFKPFHERLKALGVKICTLRRVDKIRIDDKKVTHLQLSQLDRSPTPDMKAVPVGDPQVIEVTGDVIFAIPIGAISDLVDWDVFFSASELANVRRLPTQPMASLDVYFKKKLRNVPSGVTLLQDSPYNLTFVDNSQLWKDGGPPGVTFLNLVMSDFSIFADYVDSTMLSDEEVGKNKAEITEYLLQELREYIEFDYQFKGTGVTNPSDDVDRPRCHLQTNVREELFTNEVGSWQYRLKTATSVDNLFVAGDHCQSDIDVVTIEGAVVSGLMAAEAIRQKTCPGKEAVEIIVPDAYPEKAMAMVKWMGMPYAYAAKACSMASDGFHSYMRETFPRG